MAILPVPAKMYFNDFSFELIEYTVLRKSTPIATLKGLTNIDEDGKHISFLLSDNPDIEVDDVLSYGNKTYIVKEIDYDNYNGTPEIIKAYY